MSAASHATGVMRHGRNGHGTGFRHGATADAAPPRQHRDSHRHEPMLQRMYKGLDQDIFTVDIQPAPIVYIENLEEYNEQEGLALSPEEIEYLHQVEGQLGRKLTDSEVFGFAQINSEHCRHKIFGGTFIIDGKEMESSLFQMIKKTTQENPHKIISAYKDNVAFAQGPVVEQFAPKDHSTSDYFVIKDIESVISIKAEALGATGAIMGSGGMVVMDEGTCMVGMAKFFLDFTAKESCGKCIHCRIGTKRMLEILTRITEGNGQPGDVELLEELCYGIKDGALCGLGQTAPNPVLTTIKYFRNEYDAHINDKKCPAGECSSLIEYSIDKDKCKGCTLCARNCPVGAISGEVKSAHTIDINKCIKCGKCIATCRFGAVVRK